MARDSEVDQAFAEFWERKFSPGEDKLVKLMIEEAFVAGALWALTLMQEKMKAREVV